MDTNNQFWITNKGREMITGLAVGESLEIDSIWVGSGNILQHPEINPLEMTDLISRIATGMRTEPVRIGSEVHFTVQYSNAKHKDIPAFPLNEFGGFAGSTLVFYGSLGDFPHPVNEYDPTADAIQDPPVSFPISIVLSEGIGITFNFPAEVFVTHEELENRVWRHEQELVTDDGGVHGLQMKLIGDVMNAIIDGELFPLGGMVTQDDIDRILQAIAAIDLSRLDEYVSSRAPANTALSTVQWTNDRAALLDLLNRLLALPVSGPLRIRASGYWEEWRPGTYTWHIPIDAPVNAQGLVEVSVTGCAGGGGGASGIRSLTASIQDPGGGGGGGGALVIGQIILVPPGTTLNITIGAGGIGGSVPSGQGIRNNGTAGGATIIAGYLTLPGGGAGTHVGGAAGNVNSSAGTTPTGTATNSNSGTGGNSLGGGVPGSNITGVSLPSLVSPSMTGANTADARRANVSVSYIFGRAPSTDGPGGTGGGGSGGNSVPSSIGAALAGTNGGPGMLSLRY